jgi:hypothetical protein
MSGDGSAKLELYISAYELSWRSSNLLDRQRLLLMEITEIIASLDFHHWGGVCHRNRDKICVLQEVVRTTLVPSWEENNKTVLHQ